MKILLSILTILKFISIASAFLKKSKFKMETLLQAGVSGFSYKPVPPTSPAADDYFSISLLTNAFLMIDVEGCLTLGYGKNCGKLYLSNGESRPSLFKYTPHLDSLEYVYNGQDESLKSGRYCLTALTSADTPCTDNNCANIYAVRTNEENCRNYPNTR